jgi:hypothetical protein
MKERGPARVHLGKILRSKNGCETRSAGLGVEISGE